jgi:hypothetical protein
MIKVIDIQGISLTIGTDWFSCESESKLSSDIKSQSDKAAMPYVSHRKSSDNGIIQYSLSDDDKSLNSYSGADLVSSVIEDSNFIYIYKINDALSWIFSCYDGEIVSGSDRLIPNENIQDNVDKVIESLQIDISQFSVHVDSSLEVELDELSDVITNISSILEVSTTRELVTFYLARKKLPKKAIAAIATAIIISTGYLAFDGSDDASEGFKKPDIDISTLRTKLPKSASSIRGRNDIINSEIIKTSSEVIVDAYEEELKWINNDLSNISEIKLFTQIIEKLKIQDMYNGGWKSSSFIFDYSQPTVFEVTWGKKPYGTSLTLSRSLEYDYISFDETGHSASSFHNTSSLEENKRENLINILNDKEGDLTHFMHEIEVSRLGWYAEINKPSKRPKPIDGVKNKVVAEERQLKTNSRTFRITGNGIYNISKFQTIVSKYDRFMIERVVVELNSKLDWVIYGVFYENIL